MATAAELLDHIRDFLASEESDLPQFKGVRQQGQQLQRMLSTAGAGDVDSDHEPTPGEEAADLAAQKARESGGEGPTVPDTGGKKPATFQEAREAAQEVMRGAPTADE